MSESLSLPARGPIVVALPSLRGGGSEKTTITLAQGFAELGYELHLAIIDGSDDDWKAEGIKHVHALGSSDKASAMRALIGEVQPLFVVTSRPDIVQEDPRRVTLCTVHTTPTSRSRRLAPWKRWAKLRRVRSLYKDRHLIVQSNGMYVDVLHRVRSQPASIRIIENPFNLSEIHQASARALPEWAPKEFILHIGTFKRYKRHDTLLAAFADCPIDLPLVLLGRDVENGAGTARVQRYIRRHGLQDRVILAGFDADVYRWLRATKLLVLSSESEGMPRVLVEASILGTPIASTDCESGPREIMGGELARFLVAVGDHKALGRAMMEAMGDRSIFAGRDMSRFSHTHVARRYVEAVEEIGGYQLD